MKKNYGQNMLLHTSYWGDKDTFKLMPITQDCPFTEAIYDPSTTLLVVISKVGKENFQNVPRLDEQGDAIRATKPRSNGKAYKEQRILMPVLQEYYLTDPEEQKAFIADFAVNADTYNYSRFLRNMETEPKLALAPEKQPIVDTTGNPLKSGK